VNIKTGCYNLTTGRRILAELETSIKKANKIDALNLVSKRTADSSTEHEDHSIAPVYVKH
jgi:hypothetical protein